MTEENNKQKYFENHQRAAKFPWSIYHASLEESLINFLIKNQQEKKLKVLVIGPGFFFELEKLKSLNYIIDVLDIDQRVLGNLSNERINEKIWSQDGTLKMIHSETYDLIYAKEVIEHIVEIESYFNNIKRILKKKGKAWFSTPNYGYFLLPLLESTFLEVIAKINGYSRKEIHPTKFSKKRLDQKLRDSGFQKFIITESYLKLALILEIET